MGRFRGRRCGRGRRSRWELGVGGAWWWLSGCSALVIGGWERLAE